LPAQKITLKIRVAKKPLKSARQKPNENAAFHQIHSGALDHNEEFQVNGWRKFDHPIDGGGKMSLDEGNSRCPCNQGGASLNITNFQQIRHLC